MNRTFVRLLLAVVLVLVGIALAQKPVENINPNNHPNLAAAQHLCAESYEKIVAAQKANNYDMQGHAEKAKQLLIQVNQELKMAAEAANQANKNKR